LSTKLIFRAEELIYGFLLNISSFVIFIFIFKTRSETGPGFGSRSGSVSAKRLHQDPGSMNSVNLDLKKLIKNGTKVERDVKNSL
jgi:hypothetical protein